MRVRRLALCVLLLAGSALHAAERKVVLVVRVDSPVQQLEPLEIQKLFLGWPVARENHALRPVRNSSDTALNDVFLQYVVAMSQSAYDRRILSQVLQHGRPRPVELGKSSDVVNALSTDRYVVTYMWLKDVPANPRLRIIRVLWTE